MKKQTKQLIEVVSGSKKACQIFDKKRIHQHPAKLHRAISVWLFNQNQTLLQQRSQRKLVAAKQWGNAVCGNVLKGESSLECVERRLKQELNIDFSEIKQLQHIYEFRYQICADQQFGENEIDQIYFASYQGKIDPNPNEVITTCWVDIEELLKKADEIKKLYKSLKKNNKIFNSSQTLNYNCSSLLNKKIVQIQLGEKRLLTAWTSLMLYEDRFTQAVKNYIKI